MVTIRRTIGALAFAAILALSLAATSTSAYAATANPDGHGAIVDKGPGSWNGTGPFLATGITWE